VNVKNQQLIRRLPNGVCFGQKRPRQWICGTTEPLWTYHHDFTEWMNNSFIESSETRQRTTLKSTAKPSGILYGFFQTKDDEILVIMKWIGETQQQKREGYKQLTVDQLIGCSYAGDSRPRWDESRSRQRRFRLQTITI